MVVKYLPIILSVASFALYYREKLWLNRPMSPFWSLIFSEKAYKSKEFLTAGWKVPMNSNVWSVLILIFLTSGIVRATLPLPPALPDPPALPLPPGLPDPPALPLPPALPDPPALPLPPGLPDPPALPLPPGLPDPPAPPLPPPLPNPPCLPVRANFIGASSATSAVASPAAASLAAPAAASPALAAAAAAPGTSFQSLKILTQPQNLTVGVDSAAAIVASVDFSAGATSKTAYRVISVGGVGSPSSEIAKGDVPESGKVKIPGSALTKSGSYAISFERSYSQGGTLTAVSTPFYVNVVNWAQLTGAYEALLVAQSPDNDVDGASSRGWVSIVVSKTGAVSGKLSYNEPIKSLDSSVGIRGFRLVMRSFSGAFEVDKSNALKVKFTPKAKVSGESDMQVLTAELDNSQTPPSIAVGVVDLSLGGLNSPTQALISRTGSMPKTLTKLPAQNASMVGRYALSGAVGVDAFASFQVTSTGRVFWVISRPGRTGSGSGTLNDSVSSQLTAPFYQAESFSPRNLFESSSLLGQLSFVTDQNGTGWEPCFSDSFGNGHLESQRTPNPAAEIPSTAGAPVDEVDFSVREAVNLSALGATSYSGLVQSTPLTLTIQDPLPDSDGHSATYSWIVTIPSSGGGMVPKPVSGGEKCPPLVFRLDRSTGLFTGNYTSPKGGRRTVLGSLVNPLVSSQAARGWVEVKLPPGLSSSSWTLNVLQ